MNDLLIVVIGACMSEPCLNGAICFEDVNGENFFCSCTADWQGPTCAEPLQNNCDPNPCMNGGACTSNLNIFQCDCPEGFAGALCQLGKYMLLFFVLLYSLDLRNWSTKGNECYFKALSWVVWIASQEFLSFSVEWNWSCLYRESSVHWNIHLK